ncbi:hypothetical protein GCM10010869_15310 [Mesorhizobium tianshanense]|nr:hypothetical protein GCM10010869_15310 [Mesorhizobium tianshanense]
MFAFPTVPHIAPPIASLTTDDDRFFNVNAKTLRNTMIGNFLDWCGVSIPCGTGAAGMPVGFLLSALPGEDERLLAFSLLSSRSSTGATPTRSHPDRVWNPACVHAHYN